MLEKLSTASVLAFERKLDPSYAVFHSGSWSEQAKASAWVPIGIQEKSVRGTISNRLKAKDQDPAKLDASIANPNLQTVDIATLPADADTLRVRFTLRVLAGTGTPSACNNAGYRTRLQSVVQGYVEQNGFTELALRYAANLANGRFLWRNRIGAESVQVEVARMQNGASSQSWTFDALALDLRGLEQPNQDVQALGKLIASGLAGETHVLLQVSAYVRLGRGQEVFPSQELILDKDTKKEKSRTLYQVQDVAAIHSQKIGNALRTIDTWYDEAQEVGPIAVEPYGSVTTHGRAYRQPKQKQDFYTLLDDWLLKDKTPTVEQQHFVMAVLIRGGVFGEAG
ncbi:type I-F CRISPR-associated protein Csy3 [Paraburkholderia bonniea]|uniref:type I-F CRISPR-associated protein Csy3 n=1 Tax=Paraburkholderia bonniea TaxID=2152891 RepID=UPI0025748295|nr:type I-F CRISPR-associated protein Csy3 [Paraburkholderia bonniea]WJF90048.1 type I-F CRISPR-associated protein Csy3 [Paraburkholderia bonniea]WJF93362.1 type I-F CRISPR-associated protein Csy3 [Paraburkholderia bonniea]